MIQNQNLKAMAMAFGGFTLWTMGDAAIRYLRDYPPIQIAFLCGIYSLALLIAFSPYFGGLAETFRKPKLGLQIFRGVVLGVCGLTSFYTFAYLELPTAYAIIFLAPFFAKILSVKLNREAVPKAFWLLSALAFLGVLIALRPGTLPMNIGVLTAFLSTGLFALGYVLGRTIGEENQTSLSTCLFPDICMVVMFMVPTFINFVPMEPHDFYVAVFIGAQSAIGTMLVSVAYAKAPTAYIAPVHFTQIVWGVIWGALLFREYPDAWTIVGALIIIGAGVMLVRLGRAS
ncbi:MAG: DMT family transporter [Proteobacteria bacterium]|nr:DMT family transporter [Pseudomonadota bacterium]